MKTTSKTKNTTHSNPQSSSKPFFNKSREGTFFSNSKEVEPPFFTSSHIQTKLTIGEPGDKYEQEADSMAEKVVQKLDASNSTSVVQNKCEDCTQEEKLQNKEEEKTKISKKPIFESDDGLNNKPIQGKGIEEVAPNIETQLQNSKGSGQPLDKRTQQYMEQSFSTDFTSVKVHTDNSAVQMNQKLGAQAFTNGIDIYFNQGKYNPATKNGNKLLAHELTHVVQQNGSEIRRFFAQQSPSSTLTSVTPVPGQSGTSYIQRNLDVAAVAAAITYNQNALGGNDQFIRHIKSLLNRSLRIGLPINGTIDDAFVQAVADYQEQKRLRRPYDGKVGSRTRRALAADLRRILPGARVGAAPRAYRAAQNIVNTYMNEKILFAWWAGDCRDNNKNNLVDSDDPVERRMGDGQPYQHNRTYRGFKTKAGTCTTPSGQTLTTVDYVTNTPVKYKVCADIVSQAYQQAGIMGSTSRSVVRILRHFQRDRNCQVWRHGEPNFPSKYLPGDFICTTSGGHGHAGIVIREESTNSGTQKPIVVHLPGSTLQIARGQYDPTRTSDIRMERWPDQRWVTSSLYLGRSRI